MEKKVPLGSSEYQTFENLVFEIFQTNDLTCIQEYRIDSILGRRKLVLDFVVEYDTRIIPVDVKLYGNLLFNFDRVGKALLALEEARLSLKADLAFLALSTNLSELHRQRLTENFPNVALLDLSDLFYWAQTDSDTYDEAGPVPWRVVD